MTLAAVGSTRDASGERTGPTVGTTLFSFTDVWRTGGVTLTQLLDCIASQGLGPDVELVGYQSFRGLPAPTADEVDRFRKDVQRLGLRPTAFGVYVDRARRAGQWLSVDESVARLTDQLWTARRLGFRSARAPLGLDVDVLDRIAGVLADQDLVLTFEVQGSHTPDAPDVTTLVDWLQASPGAPVGLTFDSSVAMPGLPASYLRVLRRLGMTAAVEEQLDAAWRSEGAPFQRLGRFLAQIDGTSVPGPLQEQFVTAFIRFGHGDLADWSHVLPWVRHAHAKFWDWDDAERHVLAPHRAFVELLLGHGYAGSISSEFGGIAWLEREEVNVFDLTRQHVTFLRSVVDQGRAGRPQPRGV
jgi:hypothetical protein